MTRKVFAYFRMAAVFRTRVAMVACLLVLGGTAHLFAQLSTAAINGTVRDPSGAVIPGATVTLTSVDTAVKRSTTTNDAGAYVFTSVTPGRYTLDAVAKGFRPVTIAEFVLAVSQTGTYDFKLPVGSQASSVTVEAENQQLDVTSANLGTELPTEQINDLPTNGRNFTSLLSLTPGVVPVSTGQNNMNPAGGGFAAPVAENSTLTFPAVNGQTNRSNFFLTDGLDNFGTFLSTYAVPPIIDAIDEMKVVSHTDSAESGGVLGGVIDVVTKTGANDFHGSAWEYDRNNVFDASPFLAGVPETSFHQNQFGGAVGGPVWLPKIYNGHDKTFFFVAYQGFRFSKPSNSTFLVPTLYQLTPQTNLPGCSDAAGCYDLSRLPGGAPANPIYDPMSTQASTCNGEPCYTRKPFPGNLIPASRVFAPNIDWLKFMYGGLLPTGLDDNYNAAANTNAIDPTPNIQHQNELDVRIDEHFGSKNLAWFRYSMINSTQNLSGGAPTLATHHEVPARNWGGSYVRTFSPSLVMQLQFAHTTVQDNTTTRFKNSISSIFGELGFASDFSSGFAALNGGSLLPNPGLGYYQSVGETIVDTPKATDSYQEGGVVTKLLGRHEIRAGGGFISNVFASPLSNSSLGFGADSTSNPSNPGGTGDPLASFLLAVPDAANRRNVNEKTRPGGVMSFFGQDTWKVNDRLTMNFGLRYDYTFIPPYGTNDTIGQQGGIETGDMNFNNGTYVIQKLPPPCSQRGHAPCIPGDGTLPAHVVVDPRGKIAHNVPTNWGPRLGLSYRLGTKNVIHAGFGIVYDNWAAITQMAQNIEGSWPDIGQLIANNLNVPTSASPTPNASEQDPFAVGGTGLFPAPTPFNQVQWFYDPNIKNAYSEQYNFGFQRQITPSTALTVNYVGSESHRVIVGGYYNTALTPGPGDPQSRALYNYIGPTFYDRSVGNSSYNALQLQVDKRYSTGLSYQVAYTFSKYIDEGGDGWFGVEGGVPPDPYQPAKFGSRSVAGTDLPHVLTENTIFQIPIGKGQRWSTGSRVADYVLGNWQLNNFLTIRSGLPFTPQYSDGDLANTGNVAWAGYEHANLVGDPYKNVPKGYGFNPAAFAVPAQYTYGNAGRNSLRSSRLINVDASVFREFPLWGEGRKFQFRAETFNLFNHRVPAPANNDVGSPSTFGTITGAANSARQMQLGAKFIF